MAIALAHSKVNPDQPDRLEALMDVGHAPVQLALKPDGGEIFVFNSLSDSISEVVTNTNDVGGAYMIGDNPVRGLVSSDNSLLYVANLRSQYVTVYSIDDGRRIGSIHVGDGPSALAFSSNGLLLFVVDSRSADVAVVRTATNSLFTLIPTGRAPQRHRRKILQASLSSELEVPQNKRVPQVPIFRPGMRPSRLTHEISAGTVAVTPPRTPLTRQLAIPAQRVLTCCSFPPLLFIVQYRLIQKMHSPPRLPIQIKDHNIVSAADRCIVDGT